MLRVRACLVACIVRLFQGWLFPCQATPSSGVHLYRDSSIWDTVKQSSRVGVYKVIIVTIMFFRVVLLSNL